MARRGSAGIGSDVFLGDGSDAFGAVRDITAAGLLVNVEGAGDFRIAADAIEKVVAGRVVVRWDALDAPLQEAIRHTEDREEPSPTGEEVELVPPPGDEDQDESWAPDFAGPRRESPPWELPGRDVGSLLGAPPSISSPRHPGAPSWPPGRPRSRRGRRPVER
ncbi:MAG: hypothetical protein A3F75_12025 [Betaproteobacteria bacterium RIFCSPLOWO2_12_FULL_64_23]|nr:MAG: hypothetical protein A3F75_12025 [Betaproteobacteria bacterium RIFCSPLOWO2_12_FULL_64_23]